MSRDAVAVRLAQHARTASAGCPALADKRVTSYVRGSDVRKVRDLAILTFIETHTNVALRGPPEVGKTHLACSLGVAACQAGTSLAHDRLA